MAKAGSFDEEEHIVFSDYNVLKKEDIKQLQAIHFGAVCSDDDSMTSEKSFWYESYRPSPITDQELNGKIVVIGTEVPTVPSASETLTDKPVIPVYQYPFQTAEMMIKFGVCELCNVRINSIPYALSHMVSAAHMIKRRYCVVCSKNIGENLVYEHIKEDEHQKNTSLNCLLCNIKAPTDTHMTQHLRGLKHVKKLEALENILKSIIESNNEKLKDNKIVAKGPLPLPRRPDAQYLLEQKSCELCRVTINDKVEADLHLNTENHLRKIQLWEDKLQAIHIETDTGYCKICNIYFSGPLAMDHILEEEHKKNMETYCLTCDIRTPSKNTLLQHISGSTHLKKVASQAFGDMKLQVSQRWFPDLSDYPPQLKDLILNDSCNLCKVKLDQASLRAHYESGKHCKNVRKWIQKYEEENTNTNTYLSFRQNRAEKVTTNEYKFSLTDFPELKPKNAQKIQPSSSQNSLADKNGIFEKEMQLDSSSGSEYCRRCRKYYVLGDGHFKSPGHLDVTDFDCLLETKGFTISSREKFLNAYHGLVSPVYCGLCRLDSSNYDSFENHFSQAIHRDELLQFIEKMTDFIVEDKLNKKPGDISDLATRGEANTIEVEKGAVVNNSNSELQERVMRELKKLADSLYFSKKVPLEKALEYLQRFNGEVEEYQKTSVVAKPVDSKEENVLDGLVEPTAVQPTKVQATSTNSANDRFPNNSSEHIGVSHSNENTTSDSTMATQGNDCGETCATNKAENINLVNIATKPSKTKRRKKKNGGENVTQTQNEHSNNNNDVIEDFLNQKVAITELADNNNLLEIQVLTELTKLVDLLHNSREIPLEVTLRCLESFNREVDEYIEKESWMDK